jgi:diguanylate cyclase (GGDEF)-like protein
VGSFSLPNIISSSDSITQPELALTVRGLLGLVLIFNMYMLYQQYVLRVLRRHLATQMQVATEQKVRADTLYELAILDPLTGIYNRRFGEDYLRTEISRTEKTGGPLAVVLLDLNDFKSINDRHGHFAGDLVLQEFAHRLKKATRGSDIAVRLGGDEFLIVLPECPPEKIDLVLSRLMNVQVELGNERIPVFCSTGWAQYRANEKAEELIRRADAALYAQKAGLAV